MKATIECYILKIEGVSLSNLYICMRFYSYSGAFEILRLVLLSLARSQSFVCYQLSCYYHHLTNVVIMLKSILSKPQAFDHTKQH